MSGSGSLGPSVWAVSDGRAGNAAQVRAVVHALGETRRWMKIGHIAGEAHRADPIVLTPRLPWTLLPADKWPVPLASLPGEQHALMQPPWPTVWVAAGRRSAALTREVRKLSGGRTLTVQILDPRIPADNFDLLVTPQLPLAAFAVGLEYPPDRGMTSWFDWSPFTYPFNWTGQPAASVPCGLTPAGLPAAMQIVGPRYGDMLVLRASRAYELERPFGFPVLEKTTAQARG